MKASSVSTNSALPQRDVYILSGQSDMIGRAPAAGAGLTGLPDARILMQYEDDFTTRTWDELDIRPDGDFGPEILFGQTLADAGQRPALIKFAWGGTPLFNQPGVDNWNVAAVAPHDLANQLITYVQASLLTLGERYQIRGVFWDQGQTDGTISAAAATAWTANFAATQAYVNAALGIPALPWCWVLAGSTTNITYLAQLRAAQAGAQVDNDGYALEPDQLHLGPAGQIHSGTVAANYFLSL